MGVVLVDKGEVWMGGEVCADMALQRAKKAGR